MSSTSTLLKSIVALLLMPSMFSKPFCNPPQASLSEISWNDCNPSLDSFSWYGITKEYYNFEEAQIFCESFNSSLIMIANQYIDRCAYETIGFNNIIDETVLYSGKFVDGSSEATDKTYVVVIF